MVRCHVVALLLASACSFDPKAALVADASRDGTQPVDAAAPTDATADARCVVGSLDLCAQGTPDPASTLSGTIHTGTDARCRTLPQPGGPDACLILADGVTIGDLIGIGPRPLVVVSTTDLTITGALDVSSRLGVRDGAAANDASCAVSGQPESDLGGAAGAAGGSFHGAGGNGGEGDTDNSLGNDGTALAGLASAAITQPAFLRGGCPGGRGGDEGGGGLGGAGGSSGGAVWLVAAGKLELLATGSIRATGAGGAPGQVQSGGGGGGSGGLIVLEATTLAIGGPVSANGGGGGEGGTRFGSTSVTGNKGADGDLGATPAPGGFGALGSSGDGGAGSAGAQLDGGAGESTIVGAGGGGGAAGFIHLIGTVQGSGVVSPPAS